MAGHVQGEEAVSDQDVWRGTRLQGRSDQGNGRRSSPWGGRCRANRRTRNGRRSGGPSGRSRSYRRVCAGCSTTGPPTGPGARPCGGRGWRRCWPRANAWLSPSAPRRREAYLWRVARGPPGRTKPNRGREPGESLWRLFVAMLRLPACDSEGILTPSRCESDTAKPRPACCPRARLALLVHLVHLVSLVVALGDGHVECADACRNQKAQAHGWKEHLLRSPPLLGGLLPETPRLQAFRPVRRLRPHPCVARAVYPTEPRIQSDTIPRGAPNRATALPQRRDQAKGCPSPIAGTRPACRGPRRRLAARLLARAFPPATQPPREKPRVILRLGEDDACRPVWPGSCGTPRQLRPELGWAIRIGVQENQNQPCGSDPSRHEVDGILEVGPLHHLLPSPPEDGDPEVQAGCHDTGDSA